MASRTAGLDKNVEITSLSIYLYLVHTNTVVDIYWSL